MTTQSNNNPDRKITGWHIGTASVLGGLALAYGGGAPGFMLAASLGWNIVDLFMRQKKEGKEHDEFPQANYVRNMPVPIGYGTCLCGGTIIDIHNPRQVKLNYYDASKGWFFGKGSFSFLTGGSSGEYDPRLIVWEMEMSVAICEGVARHCRHMFLDNTNINEFGTELISRLDILDAFFIGASDQVSTFNHPYHYIHSNRTLLMRTPQRFLDQGFMYRDTAFCYLSGPLTTLPVVPEFSAEVSMLGSLGHFWEQDSAMMNAIQRTTKSLGGTFGFSTENCEYQWFVYTDGKIGYYDHTKEYDEIQYNEYTLVHNAGDITNGYSWTGALGFSNAVQRTDYDNGRSYVFLYRRSNKEYDIFYLDEETETIHSVIRNGILDDDEAFNWNDTLDIQSSYTKNLDPDYPYFDNIVVKSMEIIGDEIFIMGFNYSYDLRMPAYYYLEPYRTGARLYPGNSCFIASFDKNTGIFNYGSSHPVASSDTIMLIGYRDPLIPSGLYLISQERIPIVYPSYPQCWSCRMGGRAEGMFFCIAGSAISAINGNVYFELESGKITWGQSLVGR
jgi:hypothetical protein